jgi:signal transduction histidine kinase
MAGAEPDTGLDSVARRFEPIVTVVPYVLLVGLTAVTAAIKWDDPDALLVDLALCALTAVWMLGLFTLHPPWRDRPRVMAVFFIGLVVLMAVLVIRDPWFGFFTPAGYFFAFRLLSWPSILPGVAAVAVVAATAQSYGVDWDSPVSLLIYLAVLVVNVVPMCGFAWFEWRTQQQHDQRREALRAADEANRRLEASLAENATLQRRLLAQAREAGVLDERQRMAREIHDTLAQGLTGIVTQLQAAELAADDPAEWRRHFTAATGLARESLTEARRSVHALRPQPLETARLGDAVAEVAGRWAARHGVAVQVSTTGSARPVAADAEDALLRTAQEALANVAKHAEASRVGVTLSYLEDALALDVRDDGRGFDPAVFDAAEPVPDCGFGLLAMRQRIEGLAGTLQVESEPGAGTAVSASVPAGPAQ